VGVSIVHNLNSHSENKEEDAKQQAIYTHNQWGVGDKRYLVRNSKMELIYLKTNLFLTYYLVATMEY
jgi:hypothetical protein